MKKMELDKYEQELLDSYEREEWKSVKNTKQEIEKHHEYARNTLKKDKRVNIRMSSKDIEDIQIIAIQEGLPYQTLMASVLHKFVSEKNGGRPRQVIVGQ